MAENDPQLTSAWAKKSL